MSSIGATESGQQRKTVEVPAVMLKVQERNAKALSDEMDRLRAKSTAQDIHIKKLETEHALIREELNQLRNMVAAAIGTGPTA